MRFVFGSRSCEGRKKFYWNHRKVKLHSKKLEEFTKNDNFRWRCLGRANNLNKLLFNSIQAKTHFNRSSKKLSTFSLGSELFVQFSPFAISHRKIKRQESGKTDKRIEGNLLLQTHEICFHKTAKAFLILLEQRTLIWNSISNKQKLK